MNKPFYFLLIGLISLLCFSCNKELQEKQEEEEVNPYLPDNKWIYKTMNHYYYWREDLPDSLGCDYTLKPNEFYQSLLSPEDRFSYYNWNDNYTGTQQASYMGNRGFAYQAYQTLDNEIVYQVLYTTSLKINNPQLHRGDWIKPIDNTDVFVKGKIEHGTFCPKDTMDLPIIGTRSIGGSTVYVDSIYQIAGKKIGYFCYLEFGSEDDVIPLMKSFYQNKIDELIIDLRYNPGGLVATEKYIANCIVSQNGYGELFQEERFNDVCSLDRVKRGLNATSKDYFETPQNATEGLLGSMFGLNISRVFAIVSPHSASASEGVLLSLMPYMDVCLIGEKTVGKGVGMYTLTDKICRYQLVPIVFRYFNAKGQTVPDDGLEVDVPMPNAYQTPRSELGSIDEPLLAKAIELITGKATRGFTEPHDLPNLLKPIGDPSFVTEYKQKCE